MAEQCKMTCYDDGGTVGLLGCIVIASHIGTDIALHGNRGWHVVMSWWALEDIYIKAHIYCTAPLVHYHKSVIENCSS